MRCSLLSHQKYCALVNTFNDNESTVLDLIDMGADNFIQKASQKVPENTTRTEFNRADANIDNAARSDEMNSSESPLYRVDDDDSGMYDFMPPTRIMSAREELDEEEVEKGFYQPKKLGVHVVPAPAVRLPSQLKAFVYDRGDVNLFPPPKVDTGGKLSKICKLLIQNLNIDE